jgi:hypothetical protein
MGRVIMIDLTESIALDGELKIRQNLTLVKEKERIFSRARAVEITVH